MSYLHTIKGLPVKKYWQGSLVKTCDICQLAITDCFIDGATTRGSWAKMCPICFLDNGMGLGIDRGQEYQKTECIDGPNFVTLWVKIGG